MHQINTSTYTALKLINTPNKHFHLHCTQELPVPLYIPRWACLQTVPCKVWHQRDVASLTLVKYSEHVIGESSGTKIISPINTGISTSTLIKLPKYGPLSNYTNTALYPTTQIPLSGSFKIPHSNHADWLLVYHVRKVRESY